MLAFLADFLTATNASSYLYRVIFHAHKHFALPSAQSQVGPLLNRFMSYKATQKDGKTEHGKKK